MRRRRTKPQYRNEYFRMYREKNREKLREYSREYNRLWRKKNGYQLSIAYRKKYPEKVRESSRKSYKKHKRQRLDYHNKWERQKRKTNPKFRVDSNISTTIRRALKGRKAGRKWEELVGYTVDDLLKHLEVKFESWMSWENY